MYLRKDTVNRRKENQNASITPQEGSAGNEYHPVAVAH